MNWKDWVIGGLAVAVVVTSVGWYRAERSASLGTVMGDMFEAMGSPGTTTLKAGKTYRVKKLWPYCRGEKPFADQWDAFGGIGATGWGSEELPATTLSRKWASGGCDLSKGDEKVRVVEVGRPAMITNPVHVRVEILEGGWSFDDSAEDTTAWHSPVEPGDMFWVWETSLK